MDALSHTRDSDLYSDQVINCCNWYDIPLQVYTCVFLHKFSHYIYVSYHCNCFVDVNKFFRKFYTLTGRFKKHHLINTITFSCFYRLG